MAEQPDLRTFENLYRRKDGSSFIGSLNTMPIRDSDDRLVRIEGIIEDITERKRVEEAIRESERFLHATIDSFSANLCVLDETGTIVTVNKSWRDFAEANLPAPRDAVVGANYLAVSDAATGPDAEGAAAFAAGIRAVMCGEREEFSMEYPCHSPTEQRWFIGRVTRFPGPGIRRVVVTHENITHRKQAEEQRTRLAHVWRVNTMGKMTTEISHELNQPLCAIGNYAGSCLRLIEKPTIEMDRLREFIGEIGAQADRAGVIIRRIRNLAARRPSSRSMESFNHLVQEVLAMVTSEAGHLRISLKTDLDQTLPPVSADQIEIQQVLLNLVRNGFDAMAQVEDRERILGVRTFRPDERTLQVSVSDTGVGMTPETIERLFESFFTTKQDGLGIGLSLSKTIIASHHGRIWGEINNGPGCTFSFTLPLSREMTP